MLVQLQIWSLYLLQEGGAVGFDLRSMWAQMGIPAKTVVIILFIMSAYSIGVMIDRFMAYAAARKQSREFAPKVAGALREGKLDEAVKIADRRRHYQRVQGYFERKVDRSRGRGRRYFRSAGYHRSRIAGRHPCSHGFQLLHQQDRSVRCGDG